MTRSEFVQAWLKNRSIEELFNYAEVLFLLKKESVHLLQIANEPEVELIPDDCVLVITELRNRHEDAENQVSQVSTFADVAEARAAIDWEGIFAVDHKPETKVYCLDGYFGVEDLEALTYLLRHDQEATD